MDGEISSLMNDILGARNILNRLMDQAVLKGIKLQTRLVHCKMVGGYVREGYAGHALVEVIPSYDEKAIKKD